MPKHQYTAFHIVHVWKFKLFRLPATCTLEPAYAGTVPVDRLHRIRYDSEQMACSDLERFGTQKSNNTLLRMSRRFDLSERKVTIIFVGVLRTLLNPTASD